MFKLQRLGLILIVLVQASVAFAAGGACPTAAAYTNWTSPSTLTTLSSLGITNCYFVAANGSDSNAGTDETHAWLHSPGMPAATGNAAAAWSATIQPGTGIILRGGDTWHEGNSAASPYTGGTFGLNNAPGPQGTQANPIYVGVDPSWYSGSSWARPILTWDNPATTSTTLASCSYPSANAIDFSGGAWFILDNFELTGICANSGNWNPIYVSYGSMSGGMYVFNVYIHGWSHVGFSDPNNCTAQSQCMSAFRGGSNAYPPGDVLMFDVVDGSDSDPVPMEFCYCGAANVAYSYFNKGSQFITRSMHVFHDNMILNFANNGHANVMESMGDVPGPSGKYAVYNNVFAHLYTNSTVNSNVCFWPQPPVGSTLYWFNNLVWDTGPCELFNMGQNNANQGTISIFNSTFQNNHRTDGGTNSLSCSATGNSDPYANYNIHFISSDVTSPYASSCSGKGSDTTSLAMTNATATTQGYTAAELFAYSPAAAGDSTVKAGTNVNSTLCAALSSAAGVDSTLSDAATACQSDTGYGAAYNATNHTLTGAGRTMIGRPASTAWDIGAYQFGVAPPAPNGLAAGVTAK